MCRHTRMLKGRVNTGRSQRLLMDARALDTIGLKDCRRYIDGLWLETANSLQRHQRVVSHHIMDMKTLGRRSHQYQSPLLENTAISSPTRMPL